MLLTWNSIYVDSSRNDLNYSCSEAKYSIRSEEKVQTIIPVLWIVLKPVSAQFDAVVPAGSSPRLRSMWHSSPGGRATPPIVLGGNYTDYHYTLVQGCRGSSRQTQTNSELGSSYRSVVIKAIIQFIPLVYHFLPMTRSKEYIRRRVSYEKTKYLDIYWKKE